MTVGTLLNCLSGTEGKLKCAVMNTIPSTWDNVTSDTAKKAITTLPNDGTPFQFTDDSKYLAVVVDSTSAADMTGSTIVFDIAALFASFAASSQFDDQIGYGSINMYLKIIDYDSSKGAFINNYSEKGVSIPVGSSSSTYTLYVAPTKYSLSTPVTTVAGVFPYTIGLSNAPTVFGYQSSSDDTVKIVTPPAGVVVQLQHAPITMLWIYVIIFLLILLVLVVVVGVVMFARKRMCKST
jgi:hypothetical protein